MTTAPDPDVAVLVDRVARLEAELAALRSTAPPADAPRHTSRRGLLLGVAAAGAMVVAGPRRAEAAGAPLVVGEDNTSTGPTKLDLDSASAQGYVFAASDNGLTLTGQSASLVGHSQGAATFVGVLGVAENGASVAVRGDATYVTTSGVGVEGVGATGVIGRVPRATVGIGSAYWTLFGVTGRCDLDATPPPGSAVAGVLAASSSGYGLISAGSTGALYLVSSVAAGPPDRGQFGTQGVVDVDASGRLWHCVANGTPGTWRQLSGPDTAGAFHPITPTRVYDSRTAAPAPGRLAAGESRTVSVADGRDLDTGAVTLAGLVPAGATAITCNVTVVGTAGAGFVTLNPGGTTAVTAASVNWSAAGQILNNGIVARIAADRTVTLVVGGGGAATDLVVDVTGYFR